MNYLLISKWTIININIKMNYLLISKWTIININIKMNYLLSLLMKHHAEIESE